MATLNVDIWSPSNVSSGDCTAMTGAPYKSRHSSFGRDPRLIERLGKMTGETFAFKPASDSSEHEMENLAPVSLRHQFGQRPLRVNERSMFFG
jgi:hypothetical protein